MFLDNGNELCKGHGNNYVININNCLSNNDMSSTIALIVSVAHKDDHMFNSEVSVLSSLHQQQW